MSGRGHKRNRRRGHWGSGQPPFFFDGRHCSFSEHHRRETLSINLPPMLSSNEEAQYDDEVFCEIEDYFKEAKRGEPVQVGDPPQYVLSHMLSYLWEQVHLVGPVLRLVERRPQTQVPSMHARTGSLGSLPRSLGLYCTSIGWDIYLIGPSKMRDHIFPFLVIWPLVRRS